MPPKIISKNRLSVDEDTLKQDLEKYCVQAKQIGATDARVIGTADIVIDGRVQIKCRIPKCFGYGTCANCPPHTLSAPETRELKEQYRWAVVVKLEVPAAVIVRDKATILERVQAYSTMFEIVDKIESAAFYDGYYFAVGFGAGSCKSTFCSKMECAVLAGEKCRRALKARPSMEAVGMDCYHLATKLGWDIYPIGSDAKADSVPQGTLMGLIMVT